MTVMTFPERIAGIFDYLSMTHYLVILSAVAAIAGAVLVLSERQRSRSQKAALGMLRMRTDERLMLSDTYDISSSKHIAHGEYEEQERIAKWQLPAMIISIVMASVMMLSILSIGGLVSTYNTAREHGYRGGFTTNAAGLWRSIHLSPEEDALPEDHRGCLFVCYRFACPDCEATYADLTAALDGVDGVYWIATRTENGAKLLEEHPVDAVPAAVYVRMDGTSFTVLLTGTGQNSSKLDHAAIGELLDIIAHDRANG